MLYSPFTTIVTVSIFSEVSAVVVSDVTVVETVVTNSESSSKIAQIVVSSVIFSKEPSQPINFLPSITGSAGFVAFPP